MMNLNFCLRISVAPSSFGFVTACSAVQMLNWPDYINIYIEFRAFWAWHITKYCFSVSCYWLEIMRKSMLLMCVVCRWTSSQGLGNRCHCWCVCRHLLHRRLCHCHRCHEQVTTCQWNHWDLRRMNFWCHFCRNKQLICAVFELLMLC